MKILLLILFFLSVIWHLIVSYIDLPRQRAISKAFPLTFLLLYAFACSGMSESYLLLALFTSLLGDILLIFDGHGFFITGGISFLLAHIFFILVYCSDMTKQGFLWQVVLPISVLYLCCGIYIIRLIRKNTPGPMVLPMWLYLLANSAMNVMALLRFLQMTSPGAFFAFLGALLFYISDCLLFLVRFYPNRDLIPRKHFAVMFCYLMGEFFIAQGVLMH